MLFDNNPRIPLIRGNKQIVPLKLLFIFLFISFQLFFLSLFSLEYLTKSTDETYIA